MKNQQSAKDEGENITFEFIFDKLKKLQETKEAEIESLKKEYEEKIANLEKENEELQNEIKDKEDECARMCEEIEILKEKQHIKKPEHFTEDICKAASAGDIDSIRYILQDAPDFINQQDLDHLDTPLHEAVWKSKFDVVEFLIKRGAEINIRNRRKQTPLHYAAMIGNSKITEFLISNGADINATDKENNTPLHEAARKGRLNVVQILLSFNADVTIRGYNNETALEKASTDEIREAIAAKTQKIQGFEEEEDM